MKLSHLFMEKESLAIYLPWKSPFADNSPASLVVHCGPHFSSSNSTFQRFYQIDKLCPEWPLFSYLQLAIWWGFPWISRLLDR